MTHILLIEQLKLFVQQATANLLLPTSEGNDSLLNVYKMHLPEKTNNRKDVPYVIIQIVKSEDSQNEGELSASVCSIRFVFAIYSENAEDGQMALLDAISRVRIALLQKQIIGEQFALIHPLSISLYPDDDPPYFFGEINTQFSLPPIN